MMESGEDVLLDAGQRGRVILAVLLSVASAQRLKEAGRRGRRWFPERGTPVSGEDLERIRKERERRAVIFPGAGRNGRTAVCVWTKAGRIIV